jgi:hypothetical protein
MPFKFGYILDILRFNTEGVLEIVSNLTEVEQVSIFLKAIKINSFFSLGLNFISKSNSLL